MKQVKNAKCRVQNFKRALREACTLGEFARMLARGHDCDFGDGLLSGLPLPAGGVLPGSNAPRRFFSFLPQKQTKGTKGL